MMNSKILSLNNDLLLANAMPVVTRRTTTSQPTYYSAEAYDDYGVSPLYYSSVFSSLFLFVFFIGVCWLVVASLLGILIPFLLRDKTKTCKFCGAKIPAKDDAFPKNCPKCGAKL